MPSQSTSQKHKVCWCKNVSSRAWLQVARHWVFTSSSTSGQPPRHRPGCTKTCKREAQVAGTAVQPVLPASPQKRSAQLIPCAVSTWNASCCSWQCRLVLLAVGAPCGQWSSQYSRRRVESEIELGKGWRHESQRLSSKRKMTPLQNTGCRAHLVHVRNPWYSFW